jgi:2-polyprenyl-3-methyl-5-hydroxy-6-metoxy-1,4-benzoquinol methylase
MSSPPGARDVKPDNYYRNVRVEMLPYVPADAATMLDVGCGAGLFGELVKGRGPCEVWGIETVQAYADDAAGRLDRVLIGDVTVLLDAIPARYFDAIVCNDVLEHLVDPEDVLARVKDKLTGRGVVVSSIPNIRFYPTLYELVAHRGWEYEESGILDRTHLRFFTTASIRRMYERLGYEVLRHEGINPIGDLPMRFRVANAVLGGRLNDMRFVQFATVARPR